MATTKNGAKPTRTAPPELTPEARALWDATLREHEFTTHDELGTLRLLCLAHDRLAEVRRRIAADGLTILTPSGAVKSHPLLTVESQLGRDILALRRALGLA